MHLAEAIAVDLTPPDFAEGLDDWSSGDGTPDSSTYEDAEHVRVVAGDPDFGTCLEMRKIEPVQRLRYMAELPIPGGGFVEICVRLKSLHGPLPAAGIAAWPGGQQGRRVPGLQDEVTRVAMRAHGVVLDLRGVIGLGARPGVDLAWDERVLYAHVGLDLVGPIGGVVRIERLAVRDVTSDWR